MGAQGSYPSSTGGQNNSGRLSASLGASADPVVRALSGITSAAVYQRVRVPFPLGDSTLLAVGDVRRGHMEFGQNVQMQSPRVRWKWWPTTAAAGTVVWEVRVFYVRQGVAVSATPNFTETVTTAAGGVARVVVLPDWVVPSLEPRDGDTWLVELELDAASTYPDDVGLGAFYGYFECNGELEPVI